MTNIFYLITQLGRAEVIIGLALFFSLYLKLAKKTRYLFVFWLSTAGACISGFLLKNGIARPRPLDALYQASSYSFPSLHTTGAVILYGLAAYILCREIKKKQYKPWITAAAILIITAVAYSRLYLKVHYLSDVIGGAILGLMWLGLGIALIQKKKK
ncbi:MAG: phosphatase PAP2 family protein [Candidatus Jacksonbacteria bacterium]